MMDGMGAEHDRRFIDEAQRRGIHPDEASGTASRCYRIGGGFMCGDFGERCRCGYVARYLCDWPIGGGLTCSRPLCAGCGVSASDRLAHIDETAETLEFCREHARGLDMVRAGWDPRDVAAFCSDEVKLPIGLVVLLGWGLIARLLQRSYRATCEACGYGGVRVDAAGDLRPHGCYKRRAARGDVPPDRDHRWRLVGPDAVISTGSDDPNAKDFQAVSRWVDRFTAQRVARRPGRKSRGGFRWFWKVEEYTGKIGD